VGEVFTINGFGASHAAADQNDLRFVDSGGTTRSYATIAAYTIRTPADFIAPATKPRITAWVSDTHGGTAAQAVVVTNAASVPQQDIQLTATDTSISFAYSTFNGGGHTPGTDLNIKISYNQPGVAEADVFGPFTIQANTSQVFQLSPKLDPSYVA
jgi:hypothetical protein